MAKVCTDLQLRGQVARQLLDAGAARADGLERLGDVGAALVVKGLFGGQVAREPALHEGIGRRRRRGR